MKKRKIIPAVLAILLIIGAGAYFGIQTYVRNRIVQALEELPTSAGNNDALAISSIDYSGLDFTLATRSIDLDDLRISGTMSMGGQKCGFAAQVKRARLAPVSETAIGHADLTGIGLQAQDQGDLSLSTLSLDDIAIPDEYFFSGPASDGLADRLLALPRPLFGKANLANLKIQPARDETPAVADSASIVWKSNLPLDFAVNLPAFSLPRTDMESLLGFALPGNGTLGGSLACSLAAAPNLPGASAAALKLSLSRLCDLDLSFTVQGISGFSWLSLLRDATFSDVYLTYHDSGLMACIARRLMPVAGAAAMALKIGARNLFRADGGHESATLSAIEAFIDRPGTLSCRSLAPFTPARALEAMSFGRLGSLFAIQAQPGPASLGQEMQGEPRHQEPAR